MIYDTIVVGAGPAGCLAAYELAKAGKKILLLEKESLPRYKTCGGGIPAAALRHLDFDVSAAIDTWVDAVRYTYQYKDPVEYGIKDRVVAMVMRDKFDYFLAKEAVKAGAELAEGIKISMVTPEKDSVAVSNGVHEWRGKYLIGADGALSAVARLTSAYKQRSFAAALEVELPCPSGKKDLKVAEFGFGTVRGGYAWAFPKRDCLSIGIGAMMKREKKLNEKLLRWLEYLGYHDVREKIHAHPLPYFQKQVRLSHRKVLLVGDAAQLMDPLSGEGIQNALFSGKLAAKALLKDEPNLYRVEIQKKIVPNLQISARLAKIFYTFPRFSYTRAIKNPQTTELFSKMMSGEISYSEIWEKIKKKILPLQPSLG